MASRLPRTLSLLLVGSLFWFGWVISTHAFTVLQGDYWHEIFPTQSPPSLAFHALAYDPDRQVTVLFGGNTGSARVKRTWEYNGSIWSDVSPTPSPSGRENITHAMVYDTDRNKTVLFGGLSVAGVVSDTWEYDGVTWNQINTASVPLARDAHTLVYDSSRLKTVLFGGAYPTNIYLSDTWEYNGSNWQQVFPAQSPPGRNRHAAAYDSRRGRMVVFGGLGQNGALNDTWEFDGMNWQQVNLPFAPTARWNHSMTYDYQRGVIVLFGGTENGSNKLNDTWEFDGSNWRLLVSETTPPARMGTSLAYDSTRQQVVMYGGGYFQGNLVVFSDTWEYQGGPAINLPIVVEARQDIGMPYDIDRGCPSPYTGCGGDFHGFHAGVGADLVMDAYLSGASLDIQAELSQDHAAYPGRYRFGTARHVEDLRRYFFNNQQWYDHLEDYLTGDVTFFDWDGDSITDHAGIVSEVNATARPTKMVSAIGFTAENPSGLAKELPWNSYFDQKSIGHARLNIGGNTPTATAVESVQILRVWVDTPSISLKFMDVNGKVAGAGYDENLVASNVMEYIPYIPGSEYADLGTQQVITVTNPMSNTDKYHVELTALVDQTYHLYLDTLLDGVLTEPTRVYTSTVVISDTQRLSLTLRVNPYFSIKGDPVLQPSPQLSLPLSLQLNGLVGTNHQRIFNLEEIGGFYPVNTITITATDLFNQLGGMMPANKLTITPNNFTLPANGTIPITLQVNLVGAPLGMYQGSLKLTAVNCNPITIPLTILVEPRQLFLPLVTR